MLRREGASSMQEVFSCTLTLNSFSRLSALKRDREGERDIVNMPMPSSLEFRGTPLVGLTTRVETRSKTLDPAERIVPRGRFFFRNDEKFFLKGVTYGPFSPGLSGVPFPEPGAVELDLH